MPDESAQDEAAAELKYRKRRPPRLTMLRRWVIGLAIVGSAVVALLQAGVI
jgi:hypothetical protein